MSHEKSHRRMGGAAAPAPPPPPELIAEIIRLAQKERLSQSAIAIRLGCTKGKVYHILKNAGVRTVSFNEGHLLGTRRRRDDDGERIEAYPVKVTLAPVPSLEREDVVMGEPKTFEPCPVCKDEQEIDGLFGKAPCWWCQGSEPDDDEERYAYEVGNTD